MDEDVSGTTELQTGAKIRQKTKTF